MKLVLTSETSDAALTALIAQASEKRYTHASDGALVVPLAKLSASKPGTYILGIKLRGCPFEQRTLRGNENPKDATPAKLDKPEPKLRKGKKVPRKGVRKGGKPRVTTGPLGSGFVAFIDKLLCDHNVKDIVEGYPRSNYTVDEALKKVIEKFPDKNPTSVKKVIKVRPRHLERKKDGIYDDTKNRAPRWAIVGPGNNGSMTEIDALHAKGWSVEEIADFLVKTKGRNKEKATEVVKARTELNEERRIIAEKAEKAKEEAKRVLK